MDPLEVQVHPVLVGGLGLQRLPDGAQHLAEALHILLAWVADLSQNKKQHRFSFISMLMVRDILQRHSTSSRRGLLTCHNKPPFLCGYANGATSYCTASCTGKPCGILLSICQNRLMVLSKRRGESDPLLVVRARLTASFSAFHERTVL